MNNKRKVSIITLGCKVNTYESEAIANVLIDKGFEVFSELEVADIYIINTCAVTNEGERKSRGYIAKCLKLNPNAEIYVCGCASQNNHEQFLKFDNVKYVCGTSNKLQLIDAITGKIKNKTYDTSLETTYNDSYNTKHTRARAVIKIQDGCNNFCTYCLIPYIRGRERSRSLSSIRFEIEKLEKTTKEIVLTGINMSAYGSDFKSKKLELIDVCELFLDFNVKFRISSLEVNVITQEFLNRLSKIQAFQPHFHLSMQSGCDNVLKKMNRHYTVQEYKDKVALIRKYFPLANITTDVIVAFPTETEEDFETTYNTCKEIGFGWIHIFPYSKRDGTVASKWKNINDGNVAKERVKKLTMLAKHMRDEFTKKNINQIYDVIIEQKHDNYYIGHTPNFIKCYIKDEKQLQPNDVISVQIKYAYNDGAIAEIKESK